MSRDLGQLVFVWGVWGWGFVFTLVKVQVDKHTYINTDIMYAYIQVSFKIICRTSSSDFRLGTLTLTFTGSSCVSLI